ncbi:MAG: outer membrane protein [Phenylobacterium sp.]|uniref:outer membrane protein n=1 Tax=Phenylobacterium sp. TaxID=1871053 RepID=UPI00391D62A1
MKRTTLMAAVAAAALAAGAAGSAAAQDAGWYVRGDLGGAFQGEVDGTPGAEADDGLAVAGGAGYALGNGFRAEGEVVYLDSDLEGAGGGDLTTLGAFANGYYDFNPAGKVQPFVGAGLGFAKVEVDSPLVDDDDTGFAYQLKAGVGYKFNERLTGEAAYRYLGVTDVSLGSGPNALDGDFTSHAVTVGVRYKLGS